DVNLFCLLTLQPPRSPLFPYTTLFRSSTFSISGSAGTTGATLSIGSASATSDSSNNYTISGLAAGSYIVTPSKSGCTFSPTSSRSEEHTSELQSRSDLVCRLLLEKKND